MATDRRRLVLVVTLALAPALGGALLSMVLSGAGVAEQVEAMARLEVPGALEVELSPGQHVLYQEARAGAGAYRCRVVDPTGAEVLVDPSVTPTRYRRGGDEGVSVLRFDTLGPGRHRLTCEGGPARLALGRGLGGSLPLRLIPAGAGLLVGLVILLVGTRRRR